MTHRPWPAAFALPAVAQLHVGHLHADGRDGRDPATGSGAACLRHLGVAGRGLSRRRIRSSCAAMTVRRARAPAPEPALGGAFTYDNALAVIALRACGESAAARAHRCSAARWPRTATAAGAAAGCAMPIGRAPCTETPDTADGLVERAADGRWEEDAYQVEHGDRQCRLGAPWRC